MIFTAGHSTLSQDAFLELLSEAGVGLVWDVRSYPTSRWQWFKRERLETWLPRAGVEYAWVPALGGRRPAGTSEEPHGWREPGFANYQWHMTTEEFLGAADELAALGRRRTVAIMCSEGVWWRCHRSMIADYLVTAGAEVVHLQPRRLEHAEVAAERLTRYAPSVLAAWRRHLGQAPPSNMTGYAAAAAGNHSNDRTSREVHMSNRTHITQVRAVAVPVTDQDRALDFYVGTLGFEKRMDARFNGDLRWIEVAPQGSSTTIALAPLPQGGVTGVDTGIRLATEDAEADHVDLLARGVDTDPEVLRFEGTPPMFSLRDPDGNMLYVVEAMDEAA